MKARERREGRKTKSSLYHCLLGHRPADDPRCVRRTFPGTHGRASLLSPAVPGMRSVGLTDWRLTGRLLFLHGYKARNPG
ncbi:unnamed protein product [Sphagnum troendelagicum]|uniref:Uncharacterized protein n=1 Tax=Sphagnum troendelagicum TaxID=128251 RepID=A0ABP0TAL7_9BRYO